jgi:hypothetical protein
LWYINRLMMSNIPAMFKTLVLLLVCVAYPLYMRFVDPSLILSASLSVMYREQASLTLGILEGDLSSGLERAAVLSFRLHACMYRVRRTLSEQREVGLDLAARKLEHISAQLKTNRRVLDRVVPYYHALNVSRLMETVFESQEREYLHTLDLSFNRTIARLGNWHALYELSLRMGKVEPVLTSEEKWSLFITEVGVLLSSVFVLGMY